MLNLSDAITVCFETLAHGYSFESTQQELSNEYQHDRIWAKIASELEGLSVLVN